MRFLILLMVSFPPVLPAHILADEDSPLIRIQTRNGISHVGELISTDSSETKLFDIELGSEITVAKRDTLRMSNPFGDDDAARALGLPTFFAWKIGQLPTRQAAVGKVAKISQSTIYFTLTKDQIKVGQQLDVYRNKGEIVDPDTGKVLAIERPKIAKIEVTNAAAAFSKGKLVGELETELQIGDEIELASAGKRTIAVCPIPLENGQLTNLGMEISEDLTTRLVNNGTKVVERTALADVLSELLVQNTVLFEAAGAQKIGKLTGATHVVVGKIVQNRKVGKAYLRLVDVATGEILQAADTSLSLVGVLLLSDATGRAAASSSKTTPSSDMNNELTTSEEFEYLAKSRSLPNYLTTSASLERTPNGIRFLGYPKHYEFEAGIIHTRVRDFIDRNFIFEVLVTFAPDDGVTHIGIGSGQQDNRANRRAESVFVRFHSPDHGDGGVSQLGWQKPEATFGHVRQKGIHLIRMTKEGNSLAFEVDPENDGPSADDFEAVIADLRAYAPYLNNKNSMLFIGGTGTIVGTRLKILPGSPVGSRLLNDATGGAADSTSQTAPSTSNMKNALTSSGEIEYLAKSRSLPTYLTTADSLGRTPEGIRFLGYPKHYDFRAGIIYTRVRDFIDRNFIFEVLVTFGPNDGVTHIGIGSGRKDGPAKRRAESVFVRFHSPDYGDGDVSQSGWQKPEVTFGHVRQTGVHLLRMTKEGNTLTFMVVPENDGPSADGFETVIADLRAYAPYLSNKNSMLFIGGTGTIVGTRLKILP